MAPKLFITMPIPESTLKKLKKHFDVEINDKDEVIPAFELLEKVKDKDAIFSLLTDKIDKDFISKLENVKIIGQCAVGFDNIDISAATEKGIVVTNTPGVLTDTTADYAFSLMLSAARRVPESERYMRAGKYTHWGLMLFMGQDIHHKTLGLFGLGRIGKAMALRAKGFGMKIIYNDAVRNQDFEKEHGVKFVDKETLLKESDFISLHVPYLKETHHLIGEKELGMMKKTAILINTSRGPVVDEKALVSALKEKRIGGAALDVFEFEPKMTEGLAELDNAVVTPHIASASVETRTKMAELAADNLIKFFDSGEVNTAVNPEVLKKE